MMTFNYFLSFCQVVDLAEGHVAALKFVQKNIKPAGKVNEIR